MSASLVDLAHVTVDAVSHTCQLMALLNRELRAHGQYAIADDVGEMTQGAVKVLKKARAVENTVEKRFNA